MNLAIKDCFLTSTVTFLHALELQGLDLHAHKQVHLAFFHSSLIKITAKTSRGFKIFIGKGLELEFFVSLIPQKLRNCVFLTTLTPTSLPLKSIKAVTF